MCRLIGRLLVTSLVVVFMVFNMGGCSNQDQPALWGNARLNGIVSGEKVIASYYVVGKVNDWNVAILKVKNENSHYKDPSMILSSKYVILDGVQTSIENVKGKKIYFNDTEGKIKEYIVKNETVAFECLKNSDAKLQDLHELWNYLNKITNGYDRWNKHCK